MRRGEEVVLVGVYVFSLFFFSVLWVPKYAVLDKSACVIATIFFKVLLRLNR